ncbi:MAG: protease modulator HflC [Bacteroidota bacterium]|nr:protease modulator HflC [Bacteroidota bacterium]
MAKKKLLISIVLLIVLLVGISQSIYIVNEKKQVVITQFGKPVGHAITDAGIKFKIPFIQDVNFFDKRYLEWDGDPNQVPTKDKKFIFVDTYARWEITDPLQFYKRLTNERGAQSRLDDILDGETRDYIANHNIEETVRNSNRMPVLTDTLSEPVSDSLVHIKVGREKIERLILKTANERASDLGIIILDFRFKRLNYVQEVQDQVYKRMTSERFRIADKFRSKGQGEASIINGEKERELKLIQSEAFKEAEQIKGKADARSASIYADSYNQSEKSRNLYAFLKSMESFEKTFDDKTSLIISTNSEFYKYLKSMK